MKPRKEKHMKKQNASSYATYKVEKINAERGTQKSEPKATKITSNTDARIGKKR